MKCSCTQGWANEELHDIDIKMAKIRYLFLNTEEAQSDINTLFDKYEGSVKYPPFRIMFKEKIKKENLKRQLSTIEININRKYFIDKTVQDEISKYTDIKLQPLKMFVKVCEVYTSEKIVRLSTSTKEQIMKWLERNWTTIKENIAEE